MEHSSHSAVATLLTLPAAVSLGVALSPPAQAQNVISTNRYSTVSLSNYASGIPVSITAGTTIAPFIGDAVIGTSGTFWSVTNASAVNSGSGVGILLAVPGGVTNQASGVISASSYGVLMENAAGSVANAGIISAGYDGVSLNRGGAVSNTGTINGGHIGVYTGNGGGNVTNAGLITSRTGDAVSLYSGGSFSNAATGRLIGGYSGVYGGGTGASVQNAGIISGASFGVYLSGLSSVSNSGSIAGGLDGVIDVGTHGSINNTGIINGGNTGLRLGADGVVQNSGTISGGVTGVQLGAGSTLTNTASGLIQGGDTGLLAAASVSIENAGSILDNTVAGVELGRGDSLNNIGVIAGVTGIIVTGSGVSISNTGLIASTVTGGNAIALTGGADTITLDTGSEIAGNIDGGGSASEVILQGTGALSGNIEHFGPASALNVRQGADWTASGNWTIAAITNSGVFQPGIIGTPLSLTGDFAQTAGGTTRVLVTPSDTTHFNVTGAAQLGGNLIYVLAPGAYAPQSDDFLTASGGITGNFASVSAAQAVSSQQTSLQSLSVPVGLEVSDSARGASLVIAKPFTVAPRDSALFADTNQAMALDAERIAGTLLDHATGASIPCPAAALANEYGRQANIAGALAGGFCAAGGWLEASGTEMSEDNAYGARNAGFLAGIDRPVAASGARIGFAAGYDETSLSDKLGGTANIDTLRLGLYGALPLGRLSLTASLLDGITTGGTARATGVGGAIARVADNTVSGAVQIAIPLQSGAVSLLPAVGLQLADVSGGTVREYAPNRAFAVTVQSSSGTSLRPYLRMGISRGFVTASQITVTPQASIGVSYQASGPGGAVNLASPDGTAFAASATRLDATAGQFTGGISAGRNNWALNLRYAAQDAGNWSSQTVTGALKVQF